jgi:hypothetical protein
MVSCLEINSSPGCSGPNFFSFPGKTKKIATFFVLKQLKLQAIQRDQPSYSKKKINFFFFFLLGTVLPFGELDLAPIFPMCGSENDPNERGSVRKRARTHSFFLNGYLVSFFDQFKIPPPPKCNFLR